MLNITQKIRQYRVLAHELTHISPGGSNLLREVEFIIINSLLIVVTSVGHILEHFIIVVFTTNLWWKVKKKCGKRREATLRA